MSEATTPTDIDHRLARCAEQWRLSIADQLDGGFLARVYGCRDAEGRDLVLKLSPAIARPEVEAAALTAWEGHGAARLVAFDDGLGALLLERIRPGTSLRDEPETVAIHAAAATLRELQAAEGRPLGVPTFGDWLDWYLQRVVLYAEPGTVGGSMLATLRDAAERLAATAGRTSLVHGDFNSKNLLRAESGSYVAIDPLPHIGDPCLDIGLFAAYQPPARGIARRAAAIADLAGMNAERAMRWGAVSAIGEACETWRDDSDELQEWVVGPECAALLAEAVL